MRSRKRTSSLAGWTFTSTSSAGASMRAAATAGRRGAMAERYPASAARTRKGSLNGRPFTKSWVRRPVGRASPGRWTKPYTRKAPAAYDTGTSVSARCAPHTPAMRSSGVWLRGHSQTGSPSTCNSKPTSGCASARVTTASRRRAGLARGRAEELAPRRRIEEEGAYRDRRAALAHRVGTRSSRPPFTLSSVPDSPSAVVSVRARDGRDGRQRLAPEAEGGDADEVGRAAAACWWRAGRARGPRRPVPSRCRRRSPR